MLKMVHIKFHSKQMRSVSFVSKTGKNNNHGEYNGLLISGQGQNAQLKTTM
jgi:hypothetical protein